MFSIKIFKSNDLHRTSLSQSFEISTHFQNGFQTTYQVLDYSLLHAYPITNPPPDKIGVITFIALWAEAFMLSNFSCLLMCLFICPPIHGIFAPVITNECLNGFTWILALYSEQQWNKLINFSRSSNSRWLTQLNVYAVQNPYQFITFYWIEIFTSNLIYYILEITTNKSKVTGKNS